jgi:hypothetical protein
MQASTSAKMQQYYLCFGTKDMISVVASTPQPIAS